jgi:DNA-directed RNA polymerase subunit RPC12/RpoP
MGEPMTNLQGWCHIPCPYCGGEAWNRPTSSVSPHFECLTCGKIVIDLEEAKAMIKATEEQADD